MSRQRVRRTVAISAGAALVLSLAPGLAMPAVAAGTNPNETVNTSLTAADLAQSLVGPGVTVSNVTYAGGAASAGAFTFTDPTVVGFSQGVVLGSGAVSDVVGPNTSDSFSTDFGLPGDADLTALSGFPTFDASVLEFDFVPTSNQVVFSYAFASDEYSEYVNTTFNDVFAFFVNGVNNAQVRQVAGDPAAPFVPVAVNNINNSNPTQTPAPTPMRPDLFRDNAYNAAGPSAIDLEPDGITTVLTFQSPVNPGVVNHMKLAIADASDGVWDSSVFIKADSLVSNGNPVADLSLLPDTGAAPLDVTAAVEGQDPNGAPLTYSINWGDGSALSSGSLPNETTLEHHTYTLAGSFTVTLTVSNGTLSGTSTEDVHVTGGQGSAPVVTVQPQDVTVRDGEQFEFSASASGDPAPSVQWQESTDGGATFVDVPNATQTTYGATAALAEDGELYQAVFTNASGTATTDPAMLTVLPTDTTGPTLNPTFAPPGPYLQGQTGIVLSVNATDPSGVLSESSDPVDTSAIGQFTAHVSATDNAGNTSSTTVTYIVTWAIGNVTPNAGQTFKRTASIPVSFQLRDASGLISDSGAAASRGLVDVWFDSNTAIHPTYDKRRDTFNASLKLGKPAAGSHTVHIALVVGGVTIASKTIAVTIQ